MDGGEKRQIREGRVAGTQRIVEAIEAIAKRPRVLITASAIGYYGDTGETLVDRSSPVGRGFSPTSVVTGKEKRSVPNPTESVLFSCALVSCWVPAAHSS